MRDVSSPGVPSSRKRRRVLAPVVIALAAAGVAVPVIRAGEDGATKAKSTIQWTDDFAAGAERAKKEGKILLVYVGRHTPT